MNVLQELEQEQIAARTEERPIPDFAPGDTVRINVKVVEGSRERVQAFEGVCIARKNRGINSSFTVRRSATARAWNGFSRCTARRSRASSWCGAGACGAPLYYLRGRTGKGAHSGKARRAGAHGQGGGQARGTRHARG